MQQTTQKEKKAPRLAIVALMVAATSVILVLTVTPWNIVPTLVTEDVTVIAIMDYGCVAESVLGHSVVVSSCDANVGDTISASFYVPAMEQNGYYDRIEDKLEMVNP